MPLLKFRRNGVQVAQRWSAGAPNPLLQIRRPFTHKRAGSFLNVVLVHHSLPCPNRVTYFM